MCGIFGAIGRDLAPSAVDSVLHTLEHRGPDGSGVFVDDSAPLTLAHTRLAVIDPVAGDQPLFSNDGNIVLVANGEIYDFERLRNSLAAKGHHFSTHSDSEVIIALYREYGLGCFEHLRGEFAFLLYDRAKRLLIAGRDRFGIKPLYLARLPRGLVFASEMKAIFASGLVEPRLNAASFDPLSNPRSDRFQFPFEGIEHIPPASYLIVDLETVESRIVRYWSSEIPAESAKPFADATGKAASDAAQTVLKELDRAVRLRLRADVPVGLYLSGGIDSAFVGALMARNTESKRHSFSICFAGSGKNEQEQARETAEFIGTTHHELVVTREMLWANLSDSLWFSELPFVTLAPVGKFLLSEEAKKFVTVVLTGEGADETFLGYRGFFERAIRDTRRPSPKHSQVSAASRRLSMPRSALIGKLSLRIFHRSRRRDLAAMRAEGGVEAPAGKPIINAVQEARIAGMPFDILCFLGDREEMAHSLEARLPFLDHQLYDAAKWIPVDLKMRRGLEKAVLRDAAEGLLPDAIRLRRKSGFMMTSEAVDLFGADREAARRLSEYFSKGAFERARVFSYRAYRMASLLAKIPGWTRRLERVRRNANKVIMYMLQAHMLQEMFVDDPRWARSNVAPAADKPQAAACAVIA
jgi:asparagine synthase (glutamine-hydrolysing)